MERLVDDICTFKGKVEDVENDYIIEVQKKLKEYETSEEQGLLLRLPCKVGDTVYIIQPNGQIKVSEADMMFLGVMWDEYGKEWFTTKEAAKAALAEKGGVE